MKRILLTIAEKQGVVDYWWSSELEDGRQVFTMVVTDDSRQAVLDSLQVLFEKEGDENAKILILPVDASIPRMQEELTESTEKKDKKPKVLLYQGPM